MQLLASMALILALLFGCKDPSSTDNTSTENTNPKMLQDLVGYVLECETQKGKAYVYAFAPHILGIWDDPNSKRIDYFVSQFVTKKDELIYELLLSGDSNMRTYWQSPGDLKNRRVMMKIRDGKVFVLIAHGLNEKDKTPINPHQFECVRGPLVSKSFIK
ncbi:MAG: hypothetical protein HYV97_06725 [Bdellovibrio sp.]|nr:hypothetical protein [Bdellovibrio sp.]